MKVDNEKRKGVSYLKRVADVNRIYQEWAKTGLSNREIWRRYIYPVYGISERTLYNMLKVDVTARKDNAASPRPLLLFDFDDNA
ncbi:hypothetical protein C7120_01650 [Prevotella sp. oral taxon 376]|nr:hypothetical protein C7120_01650 [Prevotella sp. oral taxon 376]